MLASASIGVAVQHEAFGNFEFDVVGFREGKPLSDLLLALVDLLRELLHEGLLLEGDGQLGFLPESDHAG